jgi:hypothetical protein
MPGFCGRPVDFAVCVKYNFILLFSKIVSQISSVLVRGFRDPSSGITGFQTAYRLPGIASDSLEKVTTKSNDFARRFLHSVCRKDSELVL